MIKFKKIISINLILLLLINVFFSANYVNADSGHTGDYTDQIAERVPQHHLGVARVRGVGLRFNLYKQLFDRDDEGNISYTHKYEPTLLTKNIDVFTTAYDCYLKDAGTNQKSNGYYNAFSNRDKIIRSSGLNTFNSNLKTYWGSDYGAKDACTIPEGNDWQSKTLLNINNNGLYDRWTRQRNSLNLGYVNNYKHIEIGKSSYFQSLNSVEMFGVRETRDALNGGNNVFFTAHFNNGEFIKSLNADYRKSLQNDLFEFLKDNTDYLLDQSYSSDVTFAKEQYEISYGKYSKEEKEALLNKYNYRYFVTVERVDMIRPFNDNYNIVYTVSDLVDVLNKFPDRNKNRGFFIGVYKHNSFGVSKNGRAFHVGFVGGGKGTKWFPNDYNNFAKLIYKNTNDLNDIPKHGDYGLKQRYENNKRYITNLNELFDFVLTLSIQAQQSYFNSSFTSGLMSSVSAVTTGENAKRFEDELKQGIQKTPYNKFFGVIFWVDESIDIPPKQEPPVTTTENIGLFYDITKQGSAGFLLNTNKTGITKLPTLDIKTDVPEFKSYTVSLGQSCKGSMGTQTFYDDYYYRSLRYGKDMFTGSPISFSTKFDNNYQYYGYYTGKYSDFTNILFKDMVNVEIVDFIPSGTFVRNLNINKNNFKLSQDYLNIIRPYNIGETYHYVNTYFDMNALNKKEFEKIKRDIYNELISKNNYKLDSPLATYNLTIGDLKIRFKGTNTGENGVNESITTLKCILPLDFTQRDIDFRDNYDKDKGFILDDTYTKKGVKDTNLNYIDKSKKL